MYLNMWLIYFFSLTERLTVTLDVFKYNFSSFIIRPKKRLTVTLDVFK